MAQRRDDPARTEELAIDELYVLKDAGDETHYHTWLEDDLPECCPGCGGTAFKKQKLFTRSYADCISDGNTPRIITMEYGFYKYRCLNPECRHIFSLPIGFATVNDNVTHRLEDRIADMVISENSYASIVSGFQDRLSRQAIGQIFNRWVRTRNDLRTGDTAPHVIGAVTGKTDRYEKLLKEERKRKKKYFPTDEDDDDGLDGDVFEYVLIFSVQKEEIRILDIMLGIDSSRIVASLRRFGKGTAKYILSDCNPTVADAVKEALPTATHIIPAEMWLKQVRGEYISLLKVILRWAPGNDKLKKMLDPRIADKSIRSPDVKNILEKRKESHLPEIYDNYHNLRYLVTNRDLRWVMEELEGWIDAEELNEDFKNKLDIPVLQFRQYHTEIAAHQDHWDIVPDSLLSATDRLEELILARRTFSEEALQAAVLYSTGADPNNWQGVEIEEVIRKLMELQERSGRKKHDYE